MGAKVASGKWMRGKLRWHKSKANERQRKRTYGTKLVWNSFKSTFREPSKRREAVMEETT